MARAMIFAPKLSIADEAVPALDMPIRAQVPNAFNKLHRDSIGGLLIISNDLGVARHFSNRVAVMSGGKIVKMGDKSQIFQAPELAYTRHLLASIPRITHHTENA